MKRIKADSEKKIVTIWGMTQWQFSLTFLFVTSFLFLIGLYAETTVPPTLPVKYFCSLCDDLLLKFDITTKRGVALEAFIAMLCWSSTYIFVRRLWNPENYGTVIEKYAADSFFGGLAAAASVIVKHMLLRSLA